jgi:RimJ/RimL family protein N-acetyltransferase
MMAPTLTTARLVLRPVQMADFPAYRDFMLSDRARYMGGPYDLAGAWGLFCHDAGLWALAGHGGLAVETKDGQTVGVVGINAGPLFPETELGWMLYEGHEGQGYATEAAGVLRDWAFGSRGLTTLVSYVYPANHASAAVARRLGARLDPQAARQADSEDDLVFRHVSGDGQP